MSPRRSPIGLPASACCSRLREKKAALWSQCSLLDGTDEHVLIFTQGNPTACMGCCLPLEELIARLVPELDIVIQVVEHEITAIRTNGEDRMTFPIRLAQNGDQQIGQRDTF